MSNTVFITRNSLFPNTSTTRSYVEIVAGYPGAGDAPLDSSDSTPTGRRTKAQARTSSTRASPRGAANRGVVAAGRGSRVSTYSSEDVYPGPVASGQLTGQPGGARGTLSQLRHEDNNGRRTLVLALFGVPLCLLGSVAMAFMEEGENGVPLIRNGFTHCRHTGDLHEAEYYGCNPWNDSDANYSLKSHGDQEKSSVHYNMTAALAIGAGFSPCAAYAIALYDQATDAATKEDQLFWAPFPPGVDALTCRDVFSATRVTPASGISGPGAYVAPDFTFRGESSETNEIARESMTFHFNPGLDFFPNDNVGVVCGADDDWDPLPSTDRDVVPLSDLHRWATSDFNPFNQCPYGGPISNYDPEEDVAPGSLGAFGIFLHAYQDTFSHRDMIDQGFHTHTRNHYRTYAIRGFVTSHYAGEFGLTASGQLGDGLKSDLVAIKTNAGKYAVFLHSQDTYDALMGTYLRMVEWLHDRQAPDRMERFGRRSDTVCAVEDIELFAFEFSSISNYVSDKDERSGAKRRSDLADSFFDMADCTWSRDE